MTQRTPLASPRRLRLRGASLLLLALLVTVGTAFAQQSFPATHVAELSGGNEVTPNQESGYGVGIFHFDATNNTLDYRITVTRLLDSVTGAAFEQGEDGAPGTILQPISLGATASTVQGSWTLVGEQVAQFAAGKIFVNIRTTRHPDGLVRGSVTPIYNASAFGMSGQNEVPPAITSTGYGDAILWVDPAARTARFSVTWHTLSGHATAVQVERGKLGQMGVAVSSTPVTGTDSVAAGTWENISDADFQALRNGSMTLNVLTDSFPQGEIRAKIVQVNTFTAAISAANEVPSLTGSAVGTGILRMAEDVNSGGGFVFGEFVIEETSGNVTSAHVHRGAEGTSGTTMFALSRQSGTIWTPPPGYIQPYGDDFNALFLSGDYVDFHTAAHTDGEARGQLVPAQPNLGQLAASVRQTSDAHAPAALAIAVEPGSGLARVSLDPLGFDRSGYLEVVDARGARVMRVPADREVLLLQLDPLADGLYFLRLVDRAGATLGVGRIPVVR